MSEWLSSDYYLSSDGTRVDEPRAIRMSAIEYMIFDSSNKIEYVVIGNKRYHPLYQCDVHDMYHTQSNAKLIAEAIEELTEKICACIAEQAEKNTDAIYEVSQELDIVGDLLRKSTKKRHKKNYGAFNKDE